MGKFRHHKGLEQGQRFEKGFYHGNHVPWTLGNNCPGPRDMIVFLVCLGWRRHCLAVMRLRRSRFSTNGDNSHGTYQNGVQSGTKGRIRSCERVVRKGFAEPV